MRDTSNRSLISELWFLLKHVGKKPNEVFFTNCFGLSCIISLKIPLNRTNSTFFLNNLTTDCLTLNFPHITSDIIKRLLRSSSFHHKSRSIETKSCSKLGSSPFSQVMFFPQWQKSKDIYFSIYKTNSNWASTQFYKNSRWMQFEFPFSGKIVSSQDI